MVTAPKTKPSTACTSIEMTPAPAFVGVTFPAPGFGVCPDGVGAPGVVESSPDGGGGVSPFAGGVNHRLVF